jgi:hypothetical protein
MTKYRPYSRREFRRRFVLWVQRNLKLVVVLTVGLIGLLTVVSALMVMVAQPTALNWYLLGVSQTAVVATYVHFLHAGFLANDREAIWHLRGAWGEENTRSELQTAKRKRLIWGWVDSISLQAGDIDHLVVSRRGGLVAVDSKWRNQPTSSDTQDMARAANKARLRAEALTQTLLKRERGARHRGTTNPLTVTPIVVLWGAAQHGVPEGARIDGVDFVTGQRFHRWLAHLEGQPVSQEAAADVLKRLNDYRAATWERATSPAR